MQSLSVFITYEPAEGVWRFVTGTPSVIAMGAVCCAGYVLDD